jgi:hypothetical protein
VNDVFCENVYKMNSNNSILKIGNPLKIWKLTKTGNT